MAKSVDDYVEQFDIRVTPDNIGGIKKAGLASNLIYIAIKSHLVARDGNLPSWLIDHPALLESDFVDLLNEGDVNLTELAHRRDSEPLIEFLARRFRYPEAIVTLGKRYYTDPSVSADKLASFLERHQDNEWLLESLARQDPSSQEKYLVYTGILAKYPEILDDVINLQLSRKRHEEATTATVESEIRRLYDTGDSAVIRALAANLHTPADLLRRMESLQGVKFAREIRNMARSTLTRQGRQ